MTYLFLRRHALTVPAALSVWMAFTALPVSAATEMASAPAAAAHPQPANDPANPDAPTGPAPQHGVMHDFTRPALSVPPGDWRAVNASVSSGGSMDHSAMGHAMPMPSAPAANPHAGHNMSGGTR